MSGASTFRNAPSFMDYFRILSHLDMVTVGVLAYGP